ncbi:MAG TPA: thiamine pyrophosphate-binding protein [Xanthobacteraceae bacterium]|nr:thiamine pyrophosphate-binding protein [Xanthobacteraceae bacterium]
MTDRNQNTQMRNGGQILVSALRAQGADRIFGVPGESALPVFDALKDANDIQFVTCRHEANASHMAEADGKITGKPGICLVSRGPGAMHAAIGLHTAMQDSTPMLLLIGQVPRDHRGREAFQEIDYTRVFASMAKWATEIHDAAAIPEAIARAYQTATQGRPGPVVLCFPEDVLDQEVVAEDPPRYRIATPAPTAEAMAELRALLAKAERPVVIAGGDNWSADARAHLEQFVRSNDLPFVAGFRSQAILDNRSPQYVGDLSLGCNPAVVKRVKDADLLLVIGDRLGDVTTQHYTLLDIPRTKQTLIHVYPSAEELGRVYHPDLPIVATNAAFAAALAQQPVLDRARWADWRANARKTYEAYRSPAKSSLDVDMAEVIVQLRETIADNAVVTNGAGNYTIWLHRFFEYREFGTQLAPRSGSMGYGLPAAIAAKLRHPDRQVIALAGDGCFQMASPDFATAVQQKLGIVVIIANNETYGSIRMHQERQFPGRPNGTALTNPDFAELAKTYGAHGETVMRGAEFVPALKRALAAEGPAIIELRLDPNQLTPAMRVP